MARKASRTVRHQFFIRAPSTRVFKALSDPDWIVRWLADRAELTPRKGGRYTLGWHDGPEHSGRVLDFVKGRRLTLGWSWPGVTLAGTRLKLSVRSKDGGSLLLVEHSGFPRGERWVDLYGGTEWGWTYFFLNLKSVLEAGHDLRSPFDS